MEVMVSKDPEARRALIGACGGLTVGRLGGRIRVLPRGKVYAARQQTVEGPAAAWRHGLFNASMLAG